MKVFIQVVVLAFISFLANAQVYTSELKVESIPQNFISIGVSSPSSILHVQTSFGKRIFLRYGGSLSISFLPVSRVASSWFHIHNLNGTTSATNGLQISSRYLSTKLMMILASGNVRIGITNLTYKLTVSGTVRATTFSAVTPPCSDIVFEKNYNL